MSVLTLVNFEIAIFLSLHHIASVETRRVANLETAKTMVGIFEGRQL